VVQKFGGTSLGTAEKMEQVINIIKYEHKTAQVVAVVSAMSSHTKEHGTTTRLLNAADAAVNQENFAHFLDAIEDTHLDVIYGTLKSRDLREHARRFVATELQNIRQFCNSLSIIREISPRSHDMVIGCGERLSSGLIATILQDHNIDSEYVDLSNVFRNLDPSQHGYQITAKRILQTKLSTLVEAGKLPVVSGFFGHVDGGIINGVGRGYTDLTAALCAGALDAKALQVWKESDGVFTGNPTKIDAAQLMSYVTPDEAAELTYFGNEVLHPFTMACAIEDEVPIHILNTFNPSGGGTKILAYTDPELLLSRAGTHGVVAICSKKDIRILNLTSNREYDPTTFTIKIFQLFAKHGVRVDLVSTSVSHVSVTIHENVPDEELTACCVALERYGSVSLLGEHAIVSCIGTGLGSRVGLAHKMFASLAQKGICIQMISQGSSEISISLVIAEADMNLAIKSLHRDFFEYETSEEISD
jgi:aspartate kinase